MALSNIFREPRREITESLVGLVPFAAFAVADWLATSAFAPWAFDHEGKGPNGIDYAGTAILLFPMALGFLWFALWFTHEIGDAICDALQDRGIHLRPRNRPQR